jgi:hypothetical protein
VLSAGGPFLPLAGGDMTGPLNYTATGGTTMRSAQDRAADVINVLDFGADPTGVLDSSTAINAAAAVVGPNGRHKTVYLPTGTYRVNHQINLTASQGLVGDARGSSILYVDQSFSSTDTAVIFITAASYDAGPVLRDFGITFAQPQDQGSRANFKTLAAGGTSGTGGTGVKYPWAIASGTASFRIQISRVRIGGAWDGITTNGNNTVFYLEDIEMSAFDCGISLGEGASGVYDFSHINNYHFWNFEIGSTLMNVFADGQTIALRVGAQNGLNAHGICCLFGRVVFTSQASGGWFHITNLALDYYQSTLEVAAAAFLQITNMYSTSGVGATRPCIDITATTSATKVLIVNAMLASDTALPQLRVAGGDVTLMAAYIQQGDITSPAILALGGTTRLNDIKIYPATGAWTQALISQNGASILQVDNLDVGSVAGATGIAVQINVDNVGNILGKLALASGWRTVVAFGPNGDYGKVFSPKNDATSYQVGSYSFSVFGASAHGCTAFGYQALGQNQDTGLRNTAFGLSAGFGVTTGDDNTFFGYTSGNLGPITGNGNTCLGSTNGYSLTSGANNTLIGVYTDQGGLTTGSNNIIIGSSVGLIGGPTGSNTINIQGVIYATGTDTPSTSQTTVAGVLNVGSLFGQGGAQFGTVGGGGVNLGIVGAAGTQKAQLFYRGALIAWGIVSNGANDDMSFLRYDNSQVYQGAAIGINRATGVVTFQQPIVNGSDRSLKTNIEPITGALDIVRRLQGVYYKHRDSPRRQVGLIAQDVLEPLPEVVFDVGQEPGEDGKPRGGPDAPNLLGVAYPNTVAVLIEAIKELANGIGA